MSRLFFIAFCLPLLSCGQQQTGEPHGQQIAFDSDTSYKYTWKASYPLKNKLLNRITVPEKYERLPVEPDSFGGWLRNLPLKEGKPDVFLYDGSKKFNQHAQFAVVDIDTGDKDLQQCADAVMRLRAEYLYSIHKLDAIHFNFTNGFRCDFSTWSKGYRPVLNGNTVSWSKKAQPADDYASFKKYMESVFTYCGTQSLSKELGTKAIREVEPGDVFVKGGFPGHAVIVLDVAINSTTGSRIFLLAQSYMPAQDIHVLVNPDDPELSPWYSNEITDELVTPEWTFQKSALKKF